MAASAAATVSTKSVLDLSLEKLALRSKGQLILIDFERIPGKSSDFILGHVRAGKEVFRREVERSGFRFVEEVQIPGFRDNYFLRFEKP